MVARLAVGEAMLRQCCTQNGERHMGSSGSRAERADDNTLPTLEPDLGNASVGKRLICHIQATTTQKTKTFWYLRSNDELGLSTDKHWDRRIGRF